MREAYIKGICFLVRSFCHLMLKLEPNGCPSTCRIHQFEKVEQF